uniref:[RNA-polymerase]-subunit kinase n=1 Tax=Oryza punctata TaxID=4537 RepID=A0A0E0MLV3_ORYPU
MAIVKRAARRKPTTTAHRRAHRRPSLWARSHPPAPADGAASSPRSAPAAAPAAVVALGDPIDGRYQRMSRIGSGTYGQVYRAVDIRTGKVVAVKCLRREDDDPDGLELAGEVRALEACRGHPHVVQLIDHGRGGGAATGPEDYIVMELVGPSLDLTIHQRGDDAAARRYAEGDVRLLMRQLLSGVRGMHDVGLMHRDLKPDNVLVDVRGNLKICDLGFARTKDKEESAPPYTNPVAALLYRSPEVILGSTTYDETVDSWALGCIMAELLVGERLFVGMTDEEMLVRIVDVLGMDDITEWSGYDDCMIPEILTKSKRRRSRLRQMFALPGRGGGPGRRPELSQAGYQVLSGLLTCNPEKRMTAAQALQHRWFAV